MSERPPIALSGWLMGVVWLALAAGTAWAALVASVRVPVLVTVLWFLVLALWPERLAGLVTGFVCEPAAA